MDTGALYSAIVGMVFLLIGAGQWFAPEYHLLTQLVSRTDEPVAGETAQQDMKSIVRAMAAAGMYIAGLFLTLAWISVFDRLYSVFVWMLPW